MNLSPYLFFDGNCREALTRYGEIFGEAPTLMTAVGIPPEFPVPEDRRGWIMHGMVAVNGGTLMASDDVFSNSQPMAGCAIQLNYASVDEGKAVFDQLAEGGEVTMAWAATFWSPGFGTLTDRFGIKWMVGADAPTE